MAKVKAGVVNALALLLRHDSRLLEYGVAERAICARFAGRLEAFFPGYDVDVEYNRHGLDPKTLEMPVEHGGGGDKLVVPDLVVHRRGHDRSNLLVVEIKKETNHSSRDFDRAKILAMKKQLRYAAGVLSELPAGPGARERPLGMEWF